MSAQRERSVVSTQRRSIHPDVPGVPWWGAMLIAVTATAIGFAFDAGAGEELTRVFAALFVIGCVAAVLMVRQAGIFTAVVQPPMILFVSVPGAYFLFHSGEMNGIKDIVINCAYPLIERFPLMVFTSGTVLLIGLGRWFLGASDQAADPAPAKRAKTEIPSRLAGIAEKITGLFSSGDVVAGAPERRQAVERPRTTRSAQPAKAATRRAEPTRPRRARQPVTESDLPVERHRRRTAASWQPEEPADFPRRRAPAPRGTRNPYERREPFERRAPHDRRGRYDYDPFEAYEPPSRRRPGTNGAAVANGTHHPISQVRYRGSPADTEARPARSRSRSSEADGWEYDI